ncbi:MAG: hypothetical protein U1A27_02960 [Phycisphaerae bacterium]
MTAEAVAAPGSSAPAPAVPPRRGRKSRWSEVSDAARVRLAELLVAGHSVASAVRKLRPMLPAGLTTRTIQRYCTLERDRMGLLVGTLPSPTRAARVAATSELAARVCISLWGQSLALDICRATCRLLERSGPRVRPARGSAASPTEETAR